MRVLHTDTLRPRDRSLTAKQRGPTTREGPAPTTADITPGSRDITITGSKKKMKGPKQNVETEYEIDCPFCSGKEHLRFMGPYHNPKYMVQCSDTRMTYAGWGEKGEKYFHEALKRAGLDVDKIAEERDETMRRLFAPPGKKTRPKNADAERARLDALRQRKKAEKLAKAAAPSVEPAVESKESLELSRAMAELREELRRTHDER